MTEVVLPDFVEAIVRANPRYRFTPFDALSEVQVEQLGPKPTDTSFAGVLAADESPTLGVKAVSSAIAELIARLQSPSGVREIASGPQAQVTRDLVAALVLDGILETEVGGTFVSQCAAYRSIVRIEADIVGSGWLATLSQNALEHGQRLYLTEPTRLAARLYFYNRAPVTLKWRNVWPNASAVLNRLGLSAGDSLTRQLSTLFEMSAPTSHSHWVSWHRRRGRKRHGASSARFKLYVSPEAHHVTDVVREVALLLTSSKAEGWKIGANACGLLRPDKLVVYFIDNADLTAFAEALRPRLAGFVAHGVPFSAPIVGTDLLSWGVDPSGSEDGVGWYSDDSWRIWLCNRLALPMVVAAQSSEADVEPWRFALAKLWLSGIDTRTWTSRSGPDSTPQEDE